MINKPLLWVLLLLHTPVYSQTYLMNGTPIASCSGTFFDSGGSTGDYSNNQNLNTTICPDGMGASHVFLRFDSLILAPGDQLCIHDGANNLAPLLACASDFPAGQAFNISASAGNASGCLTLAFLSNASGTAAGWSAEISCASPCVVPAPTGVQLADMRNGNMTWVWNAVPGSSGFEVNVNGGSWMPASGPLSHMVSGLVPGNLVVLEIRPVSSNPGCSVQSITVNKVYANCTLEATVNSTTPAVCPGTATGSASIGTTGAMGAVQFFLDNNPAPFSTGNFNNMLGAGNHQVIVRDTAGCRDTVTFTITEPPAISITITVTDAKCFGDNSGAIEALAMGGTPGYTYAWRRCQGGPIIPGAKAVDLFAGCYGVTVTDSKGCTAIAQDTIGEPEKFNFSSIQDSVSCFGGMDGKATVFVSGAMPPYTFLWGNGDKTQMADSLKAAFHSVTVTDNVGCQAVTLVQILQPTKLVIDSIVTIPITCFGVNNGSASVLAQGGKKPYNYVWSNTATGQTIQNLGPGIYTVTLTDYKGCTALRSTQLAAPPAITVQFTAVQSESCANACDGQLTLSASGGVPPLAINWSSPAIPPGTSNPQNLCPGTYTVTVTDSKGCSQTQTAMVQAGGTITVQFAALAPSCSGSQNGSLTATANGASGPYNYQWSNNQSGSTIQNLGCGTYTVTVSDSQNCTRIATDTLPCAPVLVIDSTQSKAVLCFGAANGQATVFAHGGTGALNYLWSDTNQQFTQTANNLSPGTYTVTVSDANNCTQTASVTINQPAPLTSYIDATYIDCFGGNNGTATANPSGGTPPYQFTWTGGGTTQTITGLTAGNYSLTVVDVNGCSFSSVSVDITEPTTPVQVATMQTSWACFGQNNGAAQASASGSNGPPFTYTWNNGFSGPNPNDFTSGTYTVTATDNLGCTGTQTVTIAEWDSIHANVAVVVPTCFGDTDGQAAVNLVSGGSGNGVFSNYSYQWSVPGTTDTIYINGLAGGQNYGLTITDNLGCSSTFTFFLANQEPIIPQIKADSVSCFGLSDGGVSLTSVQSPRPITQYTWNTGASGQMLSNLIAGTYTLTAIDSKGCTGSTTITVPEPALLEIELDVKPLLCNDDKNGAVQAIVSGGTKNYRYFWNTGDRENQLTGLGPGSYAVTVVDHNGCTVSDSTFIGQPNPPTIDLELVEPRCFGLKNGQARVLVSNGTLPYKYSLNGQAYVGSSIFLGLGAGNFTISVLDGAECTTTVSFTLGQPPPVTVDLGPDISITLGDSALLTPGVFNAVGNLQYSWQGNLVDSIRCDDPADCASVWVSPIYTNIYHLMVTDSNGCQGKDAVQVEVQKPRGVYVPTGFSPNGDGNNDLLVVYGKGQQILRVKVFRIFDRWGELVYEDFDFPVNDEQRGWNGQFRGQDSQTGTYVWYAEVEYLDGYEQVLRGNTALIR